mgnify:CR=1 FL=1
MGRALLLALCAIAPGALGFVPATHLTPTARRTAAAKVNMMVKLKDERFPIFEGSTGGWLRAAKKEARYAIKWSSKKEQIFELPTGGAAIMRGGDNVMYFARKEQCLALGTQLRTFKITDYRIFRIFATGEVQFLHPKDGVFPEKSNEGRISVGKQEFSIGKSKAGWKDDGTGK